MQKHTRKVNRNWYQSKNTRPREFIASFTRNASGEYELNGAVTIDRVNQYKENVYRVDARDFMSDLRNSDLTVR